MKRTVFLSVFLIALLLLRAACPGRIWAATETYDDAVQKAYNNAATPAGWTAAAASVINISGSDTHGLQYSNGNLVPT